MGRFYPEDLERSRWLDFYAERFNTVEMKPWAQRIKGWLQEGRDVYVYFNNTGAGEAVDDALYLKDLVGD